MNRVFQDAKDKYVSAVIVYFNDNKFYFDEAFEQEVSADEMKDLFFKGIVAVKNDVFYTAKSMTDAGVVDFGFPA